MTGGLFVRRSFAWKINLGITATIVLFGVLSAALVGRLSSEFIRSETLERGRVLALGLSARCVEPLLGQDFLRLTNTVTELRRLEEGVSYAFVLDAEGKALAHTFSGGFPVDLGRVNALSGPDETSVLLVDTGQDLVYDFAATIEVEGSRIGTARVGVSRSRGMAARNRVLMAISGITAGVGLLSLLLGSFFARTVTRRIDVLRDAAWEMVQGNLNVRAAPPVRVPCREVMHCGLENCPAYDGQSRCWLTAGTMCPGCAGQDHVANKVESCRECPVFLANSGDEIQSLAEAFDVMAAVLKDHIGELETARRSLSRQEQLLRTVFDVTPDLVSLQDERLVYRLINKAFRRFFSLSEEEVVGRTDKDIFSSGQAVLNEEEDRQILDTGMPLSKEIYVQRGENRRWFHVVKVPVYDGELAGRPERRPRIIGLLLTARDISVIKRYQEQLVQSQKMEDLGKLAGGVAHEINTPLGIILGYAQMLQEDLPEGREREDVAVIERQAQVCRKIVADLLGFSRQMESSWAEVDLNGSIRETVAVVRHIFQQERVFVETQLDESVPPIRGDKEKLKQVWLNLLSNAFDAIGQDGTIVIRSKLCKHRRRVVITVADTGKGISSEHMAQIFDPFFTTKPVGAGTGLGLSVSFGIIKDHKGKISAVSPAPVEYLGAGQENGTPVGPGTLFIIELPLTEEGLPEDECLDI